MSDPFVLMIAGPNGAGKTTLTQHLQLNKIDLGEYINPDEIAAELAGSLAQRTIEAQQIADKRRDDCIRTKRSFSFETVMSHPSKIEVLVRAKEAGYIVVLYFVGTDDPQTNIERVALRVAQGGHVVPEDKVRNRWFRTMELLPKAIRSSDLAFVFDNSAAGSIASIPRLVFRRNATGTSRLPQYESFGTPGWVTRFVLAPLGVNFYDNYARYKERRGDGSIVTFPIQDEVRVKEKQSESLAGLADEPHRALPHSVEIEQKILGAIISNGDAYYTISDLLHPYQMFEPLHQMILETISSLVREGKSVTLASLKAGLPADAKLAGLMTLGQYLDLLVSNSSNLPDLRDYARTVYELSLRRELIRLGDKIVQSAYGNQDQFDARIQIERATVQLRDLESGRDTGIEPAPSLQTSLGLDRISNVLPSALDSLARAYNKAGAGLRTGLRDVDRAIVGLQPAELLVLASRPGLGKTALATNIAYNIARSWRKNQSADFGEGGVVGLFSLEMSSEQIASRVISQQSRIPLSSIRSGRISEAEFEVIRNKAIEFQNLPFFIDETATLSTDQLVSRAHRLKLERGLDLLIIDNLEVMRSVARTNFGQTRKQSLQVTRQLRNLAKELLIPVLLLAQLPAKIDRRRGDLRPRLEDFDDEGTVEQDADVILLLHRDDFYLAKEKPRFGTYEHDEWARRMETAHGLAELAIAKQRNGATGTVQLFFDSATGSFSDLASY